VCRAPRCWVCCSWSRAGARTWATSAAELREYGSALLAQSYVCAFSMWRYDAAYYNWTDIKKALAELSAQVRSHAKTSCKQ
jgi:hypothetical protein